MITGGKSISGVSGPVQYYATRRAATKKERETVSAASSSRYDSVTIGERPAGFAAQLQTASRLAQEVRSNVTPGRLSALSQQIAAGEYRPDPVAIARRMLLMPEE